MGLMVKRNWKQINERVEKATKQGQILEARIFILTYLAQNKDDHAINL